MRSAPSGYEDRRSYPVSTGNLRSARAARETTCDSVTACRGKWAFTRSWGPDAAWLMDSLAVSVE
jgi:hypothetical protein